MKLSEMPLDQIIPNKTRVRSDNTGATGTVVHKSSEVDREDFTIDIDWDTGSKSRKLWHFWCDKIEVVDG
jgi:hypothetical protein